MINPARKCQYIQPFTHKDCNHLQPGDQGLCIFHLPKKTEEEIESLSKQQKKAYEQLENSFRERFYALVKQFAENKNEEIFNFRGFRFPDINLSQQKLIEKIPGWQGFNKPVDFRWTVFQRANFYWTKFQQTNFKSAIFQQKADFGGAEFQRQTNFIGTKFKQSNFSAAIFQQEADFSRAEFQQEANSKWKGFNHDFSLAQFQKADFSGANFKDPVNFNDSTIKGKLVFRGNKQRRVFKAETCYIGFREITLKPEARVTFEKANLKRASFLGTNIAKFEFHDVDWNPGKSFTFIKRKCLWEEHNYKKVDLAQLEDNYHQLVLNHEDKRDFESAMQFRMGEMEMKRRHKATTGNWLLRMLGLKAYSDNSWLNYLRLNIFNVHVLYRCFSGYGTSYLLALVWLGVWLGLAALALMLSGFMVAQPTVSGAPPAVIVYDILLSRSADFWETCRGVGHSLGYAFSVLTLQKSTLYQASGGLSVFVVGAARIVFYSQVTLLLLAVRRRFKQ